MYVCCSVLTILDVLKYVTLLWQIPTFVLKQDQRNLIFRVYVIFKNAQFCVVMYYSCYQCCCCVAAVVCTCVHCIPTTVPSLYFRSVERV